MFKLVKEGETHLVVLDDPIKISNSENIIEYFELNRLNEEEENIIGTFNIFKNLMVAPNVDIDKYSILGDALSNEKLTLKYKIAYEEENILLKIITEHNINDELYNTEEFTETINTKEFMEDVISSIRLNNSFFMYENKLIYSCIENFKRELFLCLLLEGKYVEIDNEILNEVEVYQCIDGEKKIYYTANRIVIHHTNSIICLCETIKQNKLNYNDTRYTIRIKINETKELVFKNIELIQCMNDEISYMTFDLYSATKYHDDLFIRNIEDKYNDTKDKDLKYMSYKEYKVFDIKAKDKFNEEYNSDPLFKMVNYLKENNNANAIRKYIKSNKMKSINSINVNNYLLYKEMFL